MRAHFDEYFETTKGNSPVKYLLTWQYHIKLETAYQYSLYIKISGTSEKQVDFYDKFMFNTNFDFTLLLNLLPSIIST